MNDIRCPSCSAQRDTDDNYCRRCGRQITINLPAVHEPSLPAESIGIPPSIIGSVAVLAAGTALEWLARRLAGNAARGAAKAAGRALTRHDVAPAPHLPIEPPAVRVREFLYVREVDLHS